MPFIGNQPALSYTSFAKQDFTVTATTSYSLDHPVANANELALFINFVRQEPTASYSASGTTLTLTESTSVGDDMYCVYLGKAVQTVNPPNASVGTSQLVDSAVTTAKLGDGSVTSAKLSSGKILNVVNDSDTTNTVVSTTTYTDTGLSASITPSSTSSKIFMMITQDFHLENTTNTSSINAGFKILRDSTTLYTGADDGNSFGVRIKGSGSSERIFNFVWNYSFFDTPSSTSLLTYKLQCRTFDTNHRFRLNNQINGTSKSFITLMEIAG